MTVKGKATPAPEPAAPKAKGKYKPVPAAVQPSFWDDEEVQEAAAPEWVKFDNVGDSAEGYIAKLDKRKFESPTGDRTAIEVEFVDGVKVTAGQVMLMQLLVEQRPELGSWLRITLAAVEKRGAKTLKRWKVEGHGPFGPDDSPWLIDQSEK